MFFLSCALFLSTSLAFAFPPQQKDGDASPQKQKDNDKQSGDDGKFYHEKGINDLNAIGNRNVGCNRGLFNWYSLDSQVKMGNNFPHQVKARSNLITNPWVKDKVNGLGKILSRI